MKIPTSKFVFDRKNSADDYRRKDRSKKGLIQLEIYHERQRKWLSTGIKVYKGQFNEARWVVNHPESAELNKQLRAFMDDIAESISTLVKEKRFSFENLDRILNPEKDDNLVSTLIDEMLEKFNANHPEGTFHPLNTVKDKLEAWGKIVHISDLTYENIDAYDTYLKSLGLKVSTIAVYHNKLKSVCAKAVKLKRIPYNPYDDFEIKYARFDDIKYLTEEELEKFKKFKPENERQEFAQDFAMFQAMTGMSYIDAHTLDLVTDIEEVDGKYLLRRKKRTKTGIQFSVQVLPPAMNILRKYGGRLDRYNAQILNVQFHEIGLATLGKKLSSHMFRHSFATIALRHGIPIEYVSKMLGHTKIQTTERYAKVLAEDVLKEFDKLEGVF